MTCATVDTAVRIEPATPTAVPISAWSLIAMPVMVRPMESIKPTDTVPRKRHAITVFWLNGVAHAQAGKVR
jgi:hypothetical protein